MYVRRDQDAAEVEKTYAKPQDFGETQTALPLLVDITTIYENTGSGTTRRNVPQFAKTKGSTEAHIQLPDMSNGQPI